MRCACGRIVAFCCLEETWQKTGCDKTLEDDCGVAVHLRRADADSLGGDDMGLKDWVCRHKLGVLVMIILVLELVHYLLTASWLPWQF